MTDTLYTLTEMEQRTGAPRRALQFWTDRGVIYAAPGTDAGRGVHRRYTRDEAIVGAIIHAFSLQRFTVAELARMARVIRDGLSHYRNEIEATIAGKADALLAITGTPTVQTLTVDVVKKGQGTGTIPLSHLWHPQGFANVIFLRHHLKGIA
jgi:DNA-binding transcriptional MerR regulator